MSDIDSRVWDEELYFEERADYLDKKNLIEWTAKGPHFEKIQKKLTGVGAKLLVGPRGTGKTHHMRCAFLECFNDCNAPLPLYVSFNRYLRLETFLSKASNAIKIFHAWVLAKIVWECWDLYSISMENAPFSSEQLKDFIEDVERQIDSPDHDMIIDFLSVSRVKDFISSILVGKKRARAILLLDDAALTLTHDYMVEFFDIFRSLKSTSISPKASVYPGTTQYGPRFHVGHDAESVSVWANVEDGGYTKFMDKLVTRRVKDATEIDSNILELLKYASFGVPRAFLMMLRDYVDSDKSSSQAKYNAAIQSRRESVLAEYNSIAHKVPQYSKIIRKGEQFFLKIVEDLKSHNHKSIVEGDYKKTISVGLTDVPSKAKRMIRFLVEAGLLYELPEVSHGPNRKLARYIPHMAILMQSRVFTRERGFNAAELASVLNGRSEKHPLRRSFKSVLNEEDVLDIALELPECGSCGAKRISEKQKFCHNCGQPLVDISVFDSCMSKPLDELPLTEFQKAAIKTSTSFETVEDVLTCQDPASELKRAYGIGEKYSERIFLKVNSWVDEFLV